jgi:hypothetical protein
MIAHRALLSFSLTRLSLSLALNANHCMIVDLDSVLIAIRA